MLTEHKSDTFHFCVNENNTYHGEYKAYLGSSFIQLRQHLFYDDGKRVHDQLANPLSDDELLLLCLEYGFKRLSSKTSQ